MRIAVRSGLLILLLLEVLVGAPAGRAVAAPAGPIAPRQRVDRPIHEALPITEQALLQADQPDAYDNFGRSVAMSGDTAVIGVYHDDGAQNATLDAGAAYVFTRTDSGWQRQAILRASNADANDKFGWSVAISGDTIVVGAPYQDGDSNVQTTAGAAYVFTRTGGTWSEQAILHPTVVRQNSHFGQSVAIDGDIVVIGAPHEDALGDTLIRDAGATYIFMRANGGWAQIAMLQAPDVRWDEHFGSQVAVEGATIAVAAFSQYFQPASYYGDTVYVFGRVNGTWLQQAALQPATSADGAEFGAGLALSGDTLVVGAPYLGRVFVYTRRAGAWTEASILRAAGSVSVNLFGHSVAVSGDTIAIGAPWEDGALPSRAIRSGAVYLFVQANGAWTERAILRPISSRQGDGVGVSVAVSGDTIVAGASVFTERTTQAYATGAAVIWARQALVRPASVEAGDTFAASTAIAGDTMVIGAPADDGPTNATPDAGAVYVFARAGGAWSQQAILRASNGEALDGFGASVAVDGDTIIVGAPDEDGPTNATWSVGAVYVFTRTGAGWAEQAILRPSRADRLDTFGRSVAVAGDTVVVGIPGLDRLSGFQVIAGVGGAYVFTRTNGAWAQQTLLRAPQADRNDAFGGSVAIHADTVVVGARGDDGADNTLPEAGAAYVFTRTGGAWSAPFALRALNAGAEDQFGATVAISGATIAVGAPFEDGGPFTAVYNGGAAYIFNNANGVWSEQTVLRASALDREDQFGEALALVGDTLVVGASRDDGVNNVAADAGAAYVFTRTGRGWAQHGVLRAPIAGAGDRVGLSVAVSAGLIVVGAPYADGSAHGVDVGAAYGFGAP